MKEQYRVTEQHRAKPASSHRHLWLGVPLLLIGCNLHDVGYLEEGGDSGSDAGGTDTAGSGTSSGGSAGSKPSSGGSGGSAGSAGSASGGAGSTGTTAPCDGNAVVCSSPDTIADFESNDGHLCGPEGGTLVAFSDGTGSTSPSIGDLGEFDASDDCDRGSAYALHVLISGAKDYGYGITLRLPKLVDATSAGYTGIKFKAKTAMAKKIVLKVGMPSTLETQYGGSCEPTKAPDKACNDHFGKSVVVATGGWIDYQVDFASMKQEGWGVPGAANYAAVLQLVFVFPGPVSGGSSDFDVWLDDVAFYK
jgi:hypothetical protein